MVWDSIAASYDLVAPLYAGRFADELDAKPHDRELLGAFAAAAGDPVVDVGCGPGHIGAFVGALGRRVVGLDASPAMARLAAARLPGAVVADLRAAPFATGALGGVLAFYSLIHVRRGELTGALGELHRALRPGGRLLCSFHEGRGEVGVEEFLGRPAPLVATRVELDELADACRTAGFTVVVAERRPPYANEGDTWRLYVEAVA